MRIRTALLTVATVAAGTVALAAAPASAAICRDVHTVPWQVGSQVFGHAELVCVDPNDPRDGQPMPVKLQQEGFPGFWQTVATGTGDVAYLCRGVGPHNFRDAALPAKVVPLACS